MSPLPSSGHCGSVASIRPNQPIDLGCYPTTVPATLRATWPNGSATAISSTFAARPYHPMTQGKIERWHQTLKNRLLLDNYFLPGDLEAQVAAFVDDYNHRRYHESIGNLTPADVYCGRGSNILAERQRIKQQTIANRRLQHRLQAA